MYADWCARMVNVDAPGSSSANLSYLGHTRGPRARSECHVRTECPNIPTSRAGV